MKETEGDPLPHGAESAETVSTHTNVSSHRWVRVPLSQIRRGQGAEGEGVRAIFY